MRIFFTLFELRNLIYEITVVARTPMSKKHLAAWQTGDNIEMPTDNEFRQWADNLESGGSMLRLTQLQGWVHLVTDHQRGRLFLDIADSDAPQRDVFLHCLYQLSWNSVHSDGQDRQYLQYLLHRVSTWSSKSDVIEWAEKSWLLLDKKRQGNVSTGDVIEFADIESWKKSNSGSRD